MTRKQRILTLTGIIAATLTGVTLAHSYAVTQAKANRQATSQGGSTSCPFGFTKTPMEMTAAAPQETQATPKTTPVVLSADDVKKLHQIAFEAAREGDIKTLTAYLSSGFSVNEKNARGDTLLILAAYYGHDEAVGLILNQKGVELDHKNNMGFTALTGAVYKGFNNITQRLIDKGADINTTNRSGQTPLMFAALFGREDAARILLAKGARLEAADADGNTAVTLARAQGNQKMLDILEKPPKPL